MAKALSHLPSGRLVTAEAYNDLLDYVKELTNIKCGPGIEVRQNAGGKFISLVHHPLNMLNQTAGEGGGGGTTQASYCFAKILSYDANEQNQWTYTFEEVYKDPVIGLEGHWYTRSLGRSGEAYNLTEFINLAADVNGIEPRITGSGIDVTALSVDFPGFSLMPCPVGNIVVMHIVINSGGQAEYWFEYANSVDGECE